MQHGLASGGCVSLLSCEHRAVAGGCDSEESRCRFWWLEVVLLFMLGPSCLQPFFPGLFFPACFQVLPAGACCGPSQHQVDFYDWRPVVGGGCSHTSGKGRAELFPQLLLLPQLY